MSVMRGLALLLALWLSGCATTTGHEWARFSDGSLDEWLDQQAVPELTQTFSTHPRFKSEPIRIAVLDGEQVAGSSNGLTTAIRDLLHSRLLKKHGLNVILVAGPHHCSLVPLDGYYLAIEASPSGSRGANVQIRVFDIVEQQWVSGFAYQWRGDLSQGQRDALRRTTVAESARGLRILPFTAAQSDLLAERLAADLACQLKRDGNDELTVHPARDRGAALIAGNLAGKHNIPVGGDGVLELETRVHTVGADLYQIWAILTPTGASDELSAIAASAYATQPLLPTAPTGPVRHAVSSTSAKLSRPEKPRVALLSPLRVIGATGRTDCSDNQWRRQAADLGERPVIESKSCFGLEFERDPEAQFFVISHDVDAGLRRLYPASCTKQARYSNDAMIRFPASKSPLRWDARSGTQTLYVIAARDSGAIGRLDRLIAQLPDACVAGAASPHPDPQWLNNIDSAARDLGKAVAWEAVRVYHQPRDERARLGEIRGVRR